MLLLTLGCILEMAFYSKTLLPNTKTDVIKPSLDFLALTLQMVFWAIYLLTASQLMQRYEVVSLRATNLALVQYF